MQQVLLRFSMEAKSLQHLYGGVVLIIMDILTAFDSIPYENVLDYTLVCHQILFLHYIANLIYFFILHTFMYSLIYPILHYMVLYIYFVLVLAIFLYFFHYVIFFVHYHLHLYYFHYVI